MINKTDAEKREFYKKHKIIANQEVIEMFFILEPHRSARETYKSERLTSDEDELSIRSKKRKSDDLKNLGYQPNMRASMVSRSSKRDFENHMSRSLVEGDSLSSKNSLFEGSKKKKDYQLSKSMTHDY